VASLAANQTITAATTILATIIITKKNSNEGQDQQGPTKKEIQEKQRQKIWVILFQ
jgi:ribosomal protein L14